MPRTAAWPRHSAVNMSGRASECGGHAAAAVYCRGHAATRTAAWPRCTRAAAWPPHSVGRRSVAAMPRRRCKREPRHVVSSPSRRQQAMKRIAIAILIAAFSATIAFAGERGLNLSDAQKTQWQEIRRSFHQDNRAFLDSFRQSMREFREARESNDTAKLESLRPVMQANRAQMQQLRDAQDQKLMSILNDEQKAQFEQMKAQRRRRRD